MANLDWRGFFKTHLEKQFEGIGLTEQRIKETLWLYEEFVKGQNSSIALLDVIFCVNKIIYNFNIVHKNIIEDPNKSF